MHGLVLENVKRQFSQAGEQPAGLDDFSLSVEPATIQVWLGQSGSGKSTAARCIAGLDQEYTGRILLNEADLTGVPAYRRSREMGVYYVSQSPVLYPHLTVRGNVLFGMDQFGVERAELERRMREAFAVAFPTLASEGSTVREAFLSKRVHQLSGGERQRVGLMKAMMRVPRLLMLDEPLSNVDAPQRADVRRGLVRWQRGHGVMTVWITHDQYEAVAVASSIAVIHRGGVLQIGTADQLAGQPHHRQVASLVCAGMGSPMNFLPATIRQSGNGINLFVGDRPILVQPVGTENGQGKAGDVIVGARADSLRLTAEATDDWGLRGEIINFEPLPSGVAVACETTCGTVICHAGRANGLVLGDRVSIGVMGSPPLFSAQTGRALCEIGYDVPESPAQACAEEA